MSTPLTDERLAAVRERQPQRAARFDCRQCWADVAVLLDEVDRLRAENALLREDLARVRHMESEGGPP
jgi:hypothetical protein